VTDYAGNTYPLRPDLRTCNHFTDAYSSVSPSSENYSGPIYFTEISPAVQGSGSLNGDDWGKPDCAAEFPGRMGWDPTLSAWVPLTVISCERLSIILGLSTVLSSYQNADGAVGNYAQTELQNLLTAVDTALLNCGCSTTGHSITPYSVYGSYVDPCDGCTPSYSGSDDVPQCS